MIKEFLSVVLLPYNGFYYLLFSVFGFLSRLDCLMEAIEAIEEVFPRSQLYIFRITSKITAHKELVD